jgi:hypothetical protein
MKSGCFCLYKLGCEEMVLPGFVFCPIAPFEVTRGGTSWLILFCFGSAKNLKDYFIEDLVYHLESMQLETRSGTSLQILLCTVSIFGKQSFFGSRFCVY